MKFELIRYVVNEERPRGTTRAKGRLIYAQRLPLNGHESVSKSHNVFMSTQLKGE